MKPPDYLDGAKVIQWAWSDAKPFGVITIIGVGYNIEIYGLAVCQYEKSDNYYRFSCNKNWQVEQDSSYKSVKEAIDLLPEQYKNMQQFWHSK